MKNRLMLSVAIVILFAVRRWPLAVCCLLHLAVVKVWRSEMRGVGGFISD